MPTPQPADAGVTYVDELSLAQRQARAAAGAKNVETFSPGIGKQALEPGPLDAFDLHVAPLLPGDGIRLYDAPGGATVELRRPDGAPVGGRPVARACPMTPNLGNDTERPHQFLHRCVVRVVHRRALNDWLLGARPEQVDR